MGRLTTHVLDTTCGGPAAGVRIELRALDENGQARLLLTLQTNRDGRTDQPLLEGAALAAGQYELAFHVGAYFGERNFLDVVPVRFTVTDPAQNFHVPLLCSPWSYSTYRGS